MTPAAVVLEANSAHAAFQYAEASGRVPGRSCLAGISRGDACSRAIGALSRAGSSGVDGLGRCGSAVLASVIEVEGQVVLIKTCLPVQGGRGMALVS